MKIFGETKEVAEEKIKEIQESNPSIDDLLGSKVEEQEEILYDIR